MTIWGWDLSHYDGPDSRPAVSEGFSFLTHKAGGDSDDAELAAWWGYMRPYRDRVLLGAYWVLYPRNPAARADAFLARLDGQCPGWRDGPFILQVDCERWNNDPSTQPGLADITTFCNRLAFTMPKLRPIVYAPKWVYGGALSGLGYPLWNSSYVQGTGYASQLYPGDTSSRWDAYSGQTPAILQFTSSATIAGQTTCDANAFRGTLAELTALLAPGWETDMLTDADKTWFKETIDARVGDVVHRYVVQDGKIVLVPETDPNPRMMASSALQYIQLTALQNQLALKEIAAAVAAGRLDPGTIAAAVLAGLNPQEIAAAVIAALPADQAKRTADELAARLAA